MHAVDLGKKMSSPIVRADFMADLRAYLVHALSEEGCSVLSTDDVHQVCLRYLNVRWRIISPRPRQTFWSRKLRARTLSPEVRAGIDRLVTASEKGEKLWPFMSTRIRKADYDDDMLNDWGIHHFHLGAGFESNGFVTRSSELVYAWVNGRGLYLIDVMGHKQWAVDALLECIHQNWPKVIADARAPGVVPGSLRGTWSGKDREKGRKLFCLPWQAADGTVYLPPGGGAAVGGLSMAVASRANSVMSFIHQLERWCHDQAVNLRQVFGAQDLDALHFELLRDGTDWFLRETQVNRQIRLEQPPPLW